MSAFQKEAVLSMKHWTDSLFSFTEGNHSESGHFVVEKAFVER